MASRPKETGFFVISLELFSDWGLFGIPPMRRPRVVIPPTSDRTEMLLRLGNEPCSRSGAQIQLASALRLALLTARRVEGARVVAFVASRPGPLGSAAELQTLAKALADRRTPLDVIQLGPLPEEEAGALSELVAAVNDCMGPSDSSGSSDPSPSRLLVLEPVGEDLAQWQRLELLMERLELPEGLRQATSPGPEEPAAAEAPRPPASEESTPSSSGRRHPPVPARGGDLPFPLQPTRTGRAGFIFNHATSCRYDSLGEPLSPPASQPAPTA